MHERSIPRRRFLGLLGGAAAGGGLLCLPPTLGRQLSPYDPADMAGHQPAGPFPVDEAMAARVLNAARARGAGFAELYFETRTSTRVTLVEGRVESCEQGITAGCGVRAVDGERTGYAYADQFDEPALLAAARDAAAIASSGAWGREIGAFRSPDRPSWVRIRIPFDEVPVTTRVGWLERIDRAARGADASVRQVNLEHGDDHQRFLVINSEGIWAEDALPNVYVRINVIAARDGRRGTGVERISRRMGAEQMDDDTLDRAAREAARMAVAMLDAQEAPAGEMPVVLGAGGGVLFHEAVGHGLEADAVVRGSSMFAGKVGEEVASRKVTVVDTGARPDLRGSYNLDDEGYPPQESALIEKGILRGFMNDYVTATALKVPRTGNGRRQSYRFQPLVRMSNTYLVPGDDPVEEIIRSTKSGLYARTLGGGEVDTTSGNFTFGVLEGYLIEDGRVTTPVRGATLVGNGPEIMRRIDRVGPDQKFWNGTCGKGQWVPVTSGAPTLRIAAMTVGGSGQA